MATLCIGGVCVPYSAIVPIFFLCLRWLVAKAVALGLVPQAVLDKFFPQSSKYAPAVEESGNAKACCSGSGDVKSIKTEEAFREILKEPQVIVKFTADWCKPCKEVQPEVHKLAQKYKKSASFCTIDVDELDEISQEYNVAMMPTFLVFKHGKVSDTMTGIDLLEEFVDKALK